MTLPLESSKGYVRYLGDNKKKNVYYYLALKTKKLEALFNPKLR